MHKCYKQWRIGEVVIPAYVKVGETTYTVTALATRAFENSTVTSIKIPSTVTSIGEFAFKGCYNLEKVYADCPDYVLLGDEGYGSHLSNIGDCQVYIHKDIEMTCDSFKQIGQEGDYYIYVITEIQEDEIPGLD